MMEFIHSAQVEPSSGSVLDCTLIHRILSEKLFAAETGKYPEFCTVGLRNVPVIRRYDASHVKSLKIILQ